jgi:hypothetical protein
MNTNREIRNDGGGGKVDPLEPLVEEVKRRIVADLRAEFEETLEPLLIKVARAAELLAIHPDDVRKLVARGELVGFPFPDPESHIHIPLSALKRVIQRRTDRYTTSNRSVSRVA